MIDRFKDDLHLPRADHTNLLEIAIRRLPRELYTRVCTDHSATEARSDSSHRSRMRSLGSSAPTTAERCHVVRIP